MTILFLIGTLWLIRTIRIILFYLYLWQLKEYHLGRLLDHFRTDKGKRLIWHPWKTAKIFLILVFLGFVIWPGAALSLDRFWFLALVSLYAAEALIFLRDISLSRLKKPVFTLKTVALLPVCLLILVSLASSVFLLSSDNILIVFLFSALMVDVFSPLIISIVILSLQPLTVVWRLNVIEKAKTRRKNLKDLTVIGITGSYGKTSTKEFLATILERRFNTLATRENENSEIGIARRILNDLKPEHQIFICEMGAYNKGAIKQKCYMAQPKIAILTGVNQQHLSLFGSMENLISAEGGMELLQSLPPEGTAILNGNSQILASSVKTQADKLNIKKLVWCSTKGKTDLWAEGISKLDSDEIRVEKDRLYFRVCSKEGEAADFKVNLVGPQNVENVLLATATAKGLGMTLAEIALAAEGIKPEQGAMKLSKGSGGVDVIDSSYSANPDGVLAALEHLKLWEGKKILIMPCLIELGPAAKDIHRQIGQKIGQVCDLAVITTKDWFSEIEQGSVQSGAKLGGVLFSENPEEILERTRPFCREGNVILLEGRIPSVLIREIKRL